MTWSWGYHGLKIDDAVRCDIVLQNARDDAMRCLLDFETHRAMRCDGSSKRHGTMRCDFNIKIGTHGRCDAIWITIRDSYDFGSEIIYFNVHGVMRCDCSLHGAMRCDFQMQITRDDAMRCTCSKDTGRCDAICFGKLKPGDDAMRFHLKNKRHGAMRCDDKTHGGR